MHIIQNCIVCYRLLQSCNSRTDYYGSIKRRIASYSMWIRQVEQIQTPMSLFSFLFFVLLINPLRAKKLDLYFSLTPLETIKSKNRNLLRDESISHVYKEKITYQNREVYKSNPANENTKTLRSKVNHHIMLQLTKCNLCLPCNF